MLEEWAELGIEKWDLGLGIGVRDGICIWVMSRSRHGRSLLSFWYMCIIIVFLYVVY